MMIFSNDIIIRGIVKVLDFRLFYVGAVFVSEKLPAAPVDSSDDRPNLSLRFKVLALLFVLFMALLSAEVAIRVINKEVALQRRSHDGGLFVLYEPNTSAQLLTDEFRVAVQINAFGHRDKVDRTEKRAADKRRILVFGDSFTAGWGVAFNEAYPALLEKKLGAEFVNLGKDGGNVAWYIHQIRHAMKRFEGEALIIQVFDNDLNDLRKYGDKLGVKLGKYVGPIGAEFLPNEGFIAGRRRFFRGLELNRQISRLKRKMKGKNVWQSNYCTPGSFPDRKLLSQAEVIKKHGLKLNEEPKWHERFTFHDPKRRGNWTQNLALHAEVFRQILTECKAAGYPVIIAYIPCYQLLQSHRSLGEKIRGNPLNQQLALLCKEFKIPYADCTVALGQAKDPLAFYYVWDGHFNKDGHKVLADLLEPMVKKTLKALPQKK
jgi:lysophospholipase L1-like esterase